MKKILIPFVLLTFCFSGCSEDDDSTPQTIIVDSSMPSGTFTPNRMGTFVEQNGTGSAGMAELGTDDQGTQFLRFSDSFTSNFATGTITVYLSESDALMFDPGNGNPTLQIVGPVTSGGEKFFRINPSAGNELDHVILWCGSAAIPFGYAELN